MTQDNGTMRYWMTGSDGKLYGPYGLPQLREHVDAGRLTGTTLICAEGRSEWVPASSVAGVLPPVSGSGHRGNDQALAMVVPSGVDTVALVAGYVGLFSLLLVPAPVALVLGVVALRRLSSRPGSRGHVRAIVAIVLGGLGTIALALGIFFSVFVA